MENDKKVFKENYAELKSALLVFIEDNLGEDLNDCGGDLLGTPTRVINALMEFTKSTRMNVEKFAKETMTAFEPGIYDEMIVVRDIPFVSLCRHHLLPFIGTVTIGYVPNNKILGLSKFARIVDFYSHKLQVQERMTVEIATFFSQYLEINDVGVYVQADHTCMTTRGIKAHGSKTDTCHLMGGFKNNSDTRGEFLQAIKRF